MNYEQIDMGSYRLHIIKTLKFKTITVEVNFRRPLKKEEITTRNLLKIKQEIPVFYRYPLFFIY